LDGHRLFGENGMPSEWIVEEVEGLYRIIRLKILRKTEGVDFDVVPILQIKEIAAVDRVIHRAGAISPGSIGPFDRPWYMHPHQEDHLLVMHGARTVELYSQAHPRVVRFLVTPEGVRKDGRRATGGPAMLAWPTHVFHRIESDRTIGSASLNFAARLDGYDVLTNFDIYDLNPETGAFKVIREGYKDQPEEVPAGRDG
jgi:hypothetical protein